MRTTSATLTQVFKNLLEDPRMPLYGSLLSLAHAISGIVWLNYESTRHLVWTAESICWPFFDGCRAYKFATLEAANAFVTAYIAIAVIVALLFWRRTLYPWAVAGFAGLWLMKFGIISLDYMFRHNAHYMHFFASVAFLMPWQRALFVRWQIVLFYFWAGTLKLNGEWLSGAALYRLPYFVTAETVRFAPAYVVLLELVFVWGLLSRRRWIFWPVFAQFLLFHAVSWGTVGSLYPLTMFCLLGGLLMGPPNLDLRPERGKAAIAFAGLMIVFNGLQLIPILRGPDSSLTGEGRLFALHMFDASVKCRASLRDDDGRGFAVRSDSDPVRVQCDPLVIWRRTQASCESAPPFARLSLISRKTSESEFRRIIDIPDFCAKAGEIRYSLFRKNDWIRNEPYAEAFDLIIATPTSHLAMKRFLEPLRKRLAPELRVDIVYGAKLSQPLPSVSKNLIWIANDIMSMMERDGKLDSNDLMPIAVLGRFPFYLVTPEQGGFASWQALQEAGAEKRTIPFVINVHHPVSAVLSERLAADRKWDSQLLGAAHVSEQVMKATAPGAGVAFIPALFLEDALQARRVRVLATTFPVPSSSPSLPFLSGLSPDLDVGLSFVAWVSRAVPTEEHVLSKFMSVLLSEDYGQVVGPLSAHPPSASLELISRSVRANRALYRAYEKYLQPRD